MPKFNRMTNGEKQFLRLWAAELISGLGSAIASFGVMLWVYRVTGNASHLGYLIFSYLGPQIYLSLFAGHLVDAFDRKKILILSDAGQLLGSVILFSGIFVYGESLPFTFVFIANLFAGIFAAIQSIVFLSSLSSFVSRERLLSYNGLMQIFRAAPKVFSPLIAMPLLEIVHIRGLLVLDIASFFAGIFGVLWTSFPSLTSPRKNGIEWKRFFEGFSLIGKDAELKKSLLFFTHNNFVTGMAIGLVTAFIIEKVGKDSLWVAFNTSLASLGVLLGGLFIVKEAKRIRRPFFAMGVTVVLAALFGRIFVSLLSIPWLIGTLLLLRNTMLPVMNACNDTIWQNAVNSENQGKVFGTRRFVAQGLFPVGLLLGSVLAEILQDSFLVRWTHSGVGALFLILGVLELISIFYLLRAVEVRQA